MRVIYVTKEEMIQELEEDLEQYKRHLIIDIEDPLPNERNIKSGLRAILRTYKELGEYKNE